MAEKETQAVEKDRYDFNKLNTLSVVSLATSVTGFGALAGIITGHIALSQVKTSKQGGRALAIAGLAVGYGFLVLGVVGAIARVVLGARYGMEFGGDGSINGQFGHMGLNNGGDQSNFGGIMGNANGQGDVDPNGNGGMMGGHGMWTGPGQDPNQMMGTPVPTAPTN